jgi:hypothetical protein
MYDFDEETVINLMTPVEKFISIIKKLIESE